MDNESLGAEAIAAHRARNGKIEIISKMQVLTAEQLALCYTPGVAYVSTAIKEDKEKVYEYTSKGNLVAIVSDGTRILGLGNIGPEAGLPVMEGKAVLFKKYGGVDAMPLCIATTDEKEIIKFLKEISPTFGAINLEDIESPKSLRIMRAVSSSLEIPIFHDDQQGTGVVVLAALINSLKLVQKNKDVKIIINGAGSAGYGIARMLSFAGFSNLYVFDSRGIIYEGRSTDMNEFKEELARMTNKEKAAGTFQEIVKGADVLIGISGKAEFSPGLIKSMAERPIVFALSNPTPEISYHEAKRAGAFIAATGRSDFPNQINNFLSFPGILRGLLDTRSKFLNMEMLYAAAIAITKSSGNIDAEHILPGVAEANSMARNTSNVASAVAGAAMKTGMARLSVDVREVKKRSAALIKRYARIEKNVIR